jgi:hypothetical protein
MSDFISELRADLVEAAAREQERNPIGRALRPLYPRTWRPAVVVGGLAVAAAVVAAVISVVVLAPKPTPPADNPRVVATIRIGGIPLSAAFGDGSLWVTDFRGDAVRIDPVHRRVLARVPTGHSPGAVAVARGAVWVRLTTNDEHHTQLVRIDPSRGRVVFRRTLSFGDGLAIGAGAIWTAQPGTSTAVGGVLAFSPRTGKVVASLPVANADGVAVGGGTLWTVGSDGTVTQADARSHRVVRRFSRLASGRAGASGANVLLADGEGAWALGTDRATIFRLAHGHVTRRIAVARDTQPVLARAGDTLWTTTGDQYARRHTLRRIDAPSGRVTATIDIGARRPVAIVPTRSELYVVTGDGSILVVRRG